MAIPQLLSLYNSLLCYIFNTRGLSTWFGILMEYLLFCLWPIQFLQVLYYAIRVSIVLSGRAVTRSDRQNHSLFYFPPNHTVSENPSQSFSLSSKSSNELESSRSSPLVVQTRESTGFHPVNSSPLLSTPRHNNIQRPSISLHNSIHSPHLTLVSANNNLSNTISTSDSGESLFNSSFDNSLFNNSVHYQDVEESDFIITSSSSPRSSLLNPIRRNNLFQHSGRGNVSSSSTSSSLNSTPHHDQRILTPQIPMINSPLVQIQSDSIIYETCENRLVHLVFSPVPTQNHSLLPQVFELNEFLSIEISSCVEFDVSCIFTNCHTVSPLAFSPYGHFLSTLFSFQNNHFIGIFQYFKQKDCSLRPLSYCPIPDNSSPWILQYSPCGHYLCTGHTSSGVFRPTLSLSSFSTPVGTNVIDPSYWEGHFSLAGSSFQPNRIHAHVPQSHVSWPFTAFSPLSRTLLNIFSLENFIPFEMGFLKPDYSSTSRSCHILSICNSSHVHSRIIAIVNENDALNGFNWINDGFGFIFATRSGSFVMYNPFSPIVV